MPYASRCAAAVVGLAVTMAAAAVPAHAQLTINPTFDASITTNAQASLMEGEVNDIAAHYKALFSDAITVNILFRYSNTEPNGTAMPANDLSRSNYVVYAPVWATFRNALVLDAKTANDASAIASLPATPLARDIEYTSADGRAVGLTAAGTMTATGTVGTGAFDGIVTLNSNQPFDFDREDGITTGTYDAERMFEHEIDEVLGLGSILPAVNDFRGGTAYRPEDLFRYSATGVRSLSSAGSVASYFSIDGGATDIIRFSQNSSGDYGDWRSPACATAHDEHPQYAFTCPGGTADVTLNSPEAVALDVIGYDLNTTPEPGTLTLLGLGVAGLATVKRRRVA